MKRQRLETILSRLRPSPKPKLVDEAYDLNAAAAVDILFLAESVYGDVVGRTILDLGCGSGILAIGAMLLGAKEALGVDINNESIRNARTNSRTAGVEVDFVVGDLETARGPFDVTIMNPPFGSRRRGIDVVFLWKAMSVSKRVYSLHKDGERNRCFLRNVVEEKGWKVNALYEIPIELARTYDFHKKKHYRVDADLYRVVPSDCEGATSFPTDNKAKELGAFIRDVSG